MTPRPKSSQYIWYNVYKQFTERALYNQIVGHFRMFYNNEKVQYSETKVILECKSGQ